jgi:putative transposase
MSEESLCPGTHQRWAVFRFSVIGPLLAAPPARGRLGKKLEYLAAKTWLHPITGQLTRFGLSTIQRWYYRARNEKNDPMKVLRRKVRRDLGQHPSLSGPLRELLLDQYRKHPQWSCQLHFDNLAVVLEQDPGLGTAPSYDSLLRYMKAHGLIKRPRRGPAHTPGGQQAEARYQGREVRGYQSEYVHALWHLDFHHGSVRVLLPDGRWVKPVLLAVLDDCSRFCCHAQWYLTEAAEELCHGLPQAFQKCALPRALMTDNGSAMLAGETQGGLQRLGILHERTLTYSPYQNGKQETFWTPVESRLMAMLQDVSNLTLQMLNYVTLAWISIEYNRKEHSELDGQSPLQCYLNTKDVGRSCPSEEELKRAFMTEAIRIQRRSDGTFGLEGKRFEVPSRFAHLRKLNLRFASWDLRSVYLSDPNTGTILCQLYPQDKTRNAEGRRAARSGPLDPPAGAPAPAPSGEIPPLLAKIMRQYAATGLPPAYLPKEENPQPDQP